MKQKNFLERFAGVVILLILMTAALARTAFAYDCDPSEGIVATTPVPPQKAAQLKNFLRNEQNAPAAAKILLVGDSLFDNWKDDALKSFLGRDDVFNIAVGGNRTQNALWSLENTKAKSFDPSLILIMIGVNNLVDGANWCGVAAGTKAIIAKSRSLWPKSKFLVFKILPYGIGYSSRDADRDLIYKDVEAFVKADKDIEMADVGDGITCGIHYEGSSDSFKFWPFYSHCDNYIDDDLHLSPVGYEAFGEMIKPYISKYLP